VISCCLYRIGSGMHALRPSDLVLGTWCILPYRAVGTRNHRGGNCPLPIPTGGGRLWSLYYYSPPPFEISFLPTALRKEQAEAGGKCGNYQTFLKRGFLKLSIMPKWACPKGTCLIALSSPVAAIWRESTPHTHYVQRGEMIYLRSFFFFSNTGFISGLFS
jgi:hypothetical protein